MSDDKTPLDQAVELVVFAPIGFALEAKKLLPTFVERGRNQVNVAKMMGQFAVQMGQAEATKRIGKVTEQAEQVLAELGLGLNHGAPPPAVEVAAARNAPAPDSVEAPVRSSAAASSLPIADYDSLAASQVIPRLSGLTPVELAAVRDYELGHRGRKTILGKVAQLEGE